MVRISSRTKYRRGGRRGSRRGATRGCGAPPSRPRKLPLAGGGAEFCTCPLLACHYRLDSMPTSIFLMFSLDLNFWPLVPIPNDSATGDQLAGTVQVYT